MNVVLLGNYGNRAVRTSNLTYGNNFATCVLEAAPVQNIKVKASQSAWCRIALDVLCYCVISEDRYD
jgi:hypothetical protein